MKFLSWFLVIVALACVLPKAHSQSLTSENILNPTVQAWKGSVAGQNGGTSGGGSGPAFNENTNTLIFGYTPGTASQVIGAEAFAIQHALDLSGSGIKIQGYNYSWQINNSGQQSGTLAGTVNLLRGKSVLESYTYNYNGATDGFELKTGTQNFTNEYSLLATDAMSISFTGKDNRFWAGYYGPQVRNPSLTMNYTSDPCNSNPLYSPSCSGYAAAYQAQLCSSNPLSSATCPGYAAAFFTQQCTINTLSDPSCPGYASAYLSLQCSQNALYSTTCLGYETAYFNQQCSLNGLYNSRCPNYASAYKAQQCSLDGLYARDCPNYSEAYARKMVFEKQGIASTVATAGVIAQTAPTVSASVGNDGTVSTSVSKTGDSNVDKTITPTTTTTNSSAAPAAPVQLVQPQQSSSSGGPQPQPQQAERKDGPPAQNQNQQANSQPNAGAGEKGAPQKSARQEIAERRAEAAKKDAVEKGKNLANEMGKVASMDQQIAVQNVVLQAMAFTPGFDAYGKVFVPDGVSYKPYEVYKNQRVIDNARVGRRLFGPGDRLHSEMVEMQYEGK